MRKNFTEIVFILDRSGSMSGLETDTIGGFNSMIEKPVSYTHLDVYKRQRYQRSLYRRTRRTTSIFWNAVMRLSSRRRHTRL